MTKNEIKEIYLNRQTNEYFMHDNSDLINEFLDKKNAVELMNFFINTVSDSKKIESIILQHKKFNKESYELEISENEIALNNAHIIYYLDYMSMNLFDTDEKYHLIEESKKAFNIDNYSEMIVHYSETKKACEKCLLLSLHDFSQDEQKEILITLKIYQEALTKLINEYSALV